MSVAEALLTIEEFCDLPDNGRQTELVRGRIIELPPPSYLHGFVSVAIASLLQVWVKERNLGRVVSNDSGIVTRRNPDTLRGADVAFYSYARMPRGLVPKKYPGIPPDLVIEIKSPGDRWRDVHTKVAEYLELEITVVCVLDPETRSAHLDYPDQPPRILGPNDELTFPECLPDFSVVIGSLFEID